MYLRVMLFVYQGYLKMMTKIGYRIIALESGLPNKHNFASGMICFSMYSFPYLDNELALRLRIMGLQRSRSEHRHLVCFSP